MKGTPFQKVLLMIVLAATAVALILQFINSQFKPQTEVEQVKPVMSMSQYTYTPHQPKAAMNAPEETEADEPAPPKVPREKAEAWLVKHNRNAASLLAVFRALGDANYLNEAATNFPNNPQVELAVLSRNAFPADRQKWLDLFKASSPSNSLANYLSAADCFKNGKSDVAMKELLAASGKGQFQDYGMETLLDAEELFSDSGTSAREVASYAMACWSEDNLPQLTSFKLVAQGVGEAMKQQIAAGNAESAGNLAQLGLDFTGKINSGDSGKFLINQMVGTSAERIVLSQLDQNTAYDFLNGQTPAQIVDNLKQQKDEVRKLIQDFLPAQMQMMTSESETASYMQRLKIYGEVEAMKWVIQQHPPGAAPK